MESHYSHSIKEINAIFHLKSIKKIMLHTIQYSNPYLSKWRWKEVIGILGGKVIKNNIIVTDSFAINHGGHYEVKFNNKNYILAAEINSKLYEHNEFFVGWYHSHPGLGFFYSDTDILNHIGYQDGNPLAIGLVFDHTQFNKNGKFFEVYTLNYSRHGIAGYRTVKYNILGIPKSRETIELKRIYDKILFYWRNRIVESAEKSVKKWIYKKLK